MMNHTNCTHPKTSAARAACRKARAANAQTDAIRDLIAAFDRVGDYNDWLAYAARAFADFHGTDRMEQATAVLAYFAPVDAETDAYRRRNGYLVTSDARTIVSTTLRRAS